MLFLIFFDNYFLISVVTYIALEFKKMCWTSPHTRREIRRWIKCMTCIYEHFPKQFDTIISLRMYKYSISNNCFIEIVKQLCNLIKIGWQCKRVPIMLLSRLQSEVRVHRINILDLKQTTYIEKK